MFGLSVKDLLKPIASNVIAGTVGMGMTYLAGKWHLGSLGDPGVQAEVQTTILTWMGLSIGHKTISVKTNPSNAASPSVAASLTKEVARRVGINYGDEPISR